MTKFDDMEPHGISKTDPHYEQVKQEKIDMRDLAIMISTREAYDKRRCHTPPPSRAVIMDLWFYQLKEAFEKLGEMNGTISIDYKNGIPELMSIQFNTKIKEQNEEHDYQELNDWVGSYGFITHRRLGYKRGKVIYGTKDYSYSPDVWRPLEDNEELANFL